MSLMSLTDVLAQVPKCAVSGPHHHHRPWIMYQTLNSTLANSSVASLHLGQLLDYCRN